MMPTLQHITRLSLVPFALMALTALDCAPSRTYRRRPTPSSRIEVGMSKAQVERRLGQPSSYAGKGRSEIWRYERSVGGAKAHQVMLIEFRDGHVVSFERGPARPSRQLREPALRPPETGHGSHHDPHKRPANPPPSARRPHTDPAPETGHHGEADTGSRDSAGRPDPAGSSRQGSSDRGRGASSPAASKVPGDSCTRHSECGVGRVCKGSVSGKRTCIGRGARGAACRVNSDCESSLICKIVRGRNSSCQ